MNAMNCDERDAAQTVTVVDGFVQYEVTRAEADCLVEREVAYYCDERFGDCPFRPLEEKRNQRCSWYHLTVEFVQDKHRDDATAAFREIDRILQRRGTQPCC